MPQKYSIYSHEMKKKGDEADLAGLSVDQITVFRHMTSCGNKKLLDKMLELQNPTEADINDCVLRFEAKTISRDHISGKEHINYTGNKGRNNGRNKGNNGNGRNNGRNEQRGRDRGRSRDRSRGRNNGRNEQRGRSRSKSRIPELEGKCYTCGKSSHETRDCFMKKDGFTATCNHCKGKGHFRLSLH